VGETAIDLEDRVFGNFRRMTAQVLQMNKDTLKKAINRAERNDATPPQELAKLKEEFSEVQKMQTEMDLID